MKNDKSFSFAFISVYHDLNTRKSKNENRIWMNAMLMNSRRIDDIDWMMASVIENEIVNESDDEAAIDAQVAMMKTMVLEMMKMDYLERMMRGWKRCELGDSKMDLNRSLNGAATHAEHST